MGVVHNGRGDGAGRHVLLVDDDITHARGLHSALTREGFLVVTTTEAMALAGFRSERPALVILHLSPAPSNTDMCRTLRLEANVPIVMLAPSDNETDVIRGFEAGADDYVTEPFTVRELACRMRVHLRRSGRMSDGRLQDVLRAGPVELDIGRHEARVRGRRVHLAPKEFQLLESLIRARARVRTHSDLIDHVWGSPRTGDEKTLVVHVTRLRNKIERDPRRPEHLITVRGLGYRFLDTPEGSQQHAV